MKIRFDPRAAVELEAQIGYLVEQGALSAAARLKMRCDDFFENFLTRHPRTGKLIAERGIWETWIPGTRLVIWYRLTPDELQIVRIWHASQDRSRK